MAWADEMNINLLVDLGVWGPAGHIQGVVGGAVPGRDAARDEESDGAATGQYR